MSGKITQKEIDNLKLNLSKYEEINFKIEEAAKRFLKAMSDTNHSLIANNITSIAYTRVYNILKTKTKLFKSDCVTDFSCFCDKDLVQAMIEEVVGTEKLQKMSYKLFMVRDLILKADALRNKMRELVEEYIEAEELLDAIESLSLKNGITVKIVYEKIEQLKQNILKEESIA